MLAYGNQKHSKDEMKRLFFLIVLLCASSAGAAEINYAGKADCRVAEHARVAGQAAYWSGACKDGYASGPGALQWSKDGKATERYEGTLSEGQPQGEGIAQWADGSLHQGSYRNGMLEGPGLIVFADKAKMTATFERDAPAGAVTVIARNGDRYEGGWQNGPEGSGSMTFALGGVYRGAWHEGNPLGDGEILYPNGQVLKARFNGSFQLTQQPEASATPRLYDIKQKDAYIGSNIAPVVSSGHAVPPEKSYAELTREQQMLVKRRYPLLQDDDVPAYPEKGLSFVSRAMRHMISYAGITGVLRANVSVNENGVPQSVVVLESPDSEAGKLAASVFMLAKYSPGRCAGHPCAMVVPFSFSLEFKQ